ncbi:hypothetical protein N7454_007353 [Penicillium verhagenii]|nr:hypothetical protein N7454_007353 [Penicillium verhagenii]
MGPKPQVFKVPIKVCSNLLWSIEDFLDEYRLCTEIIFGIMMFAFNGNHGLYIRMVKQDGVWEQELIKGVTSKYSSTTKLIDAAKEEFKQQTSRELKHDVADNSSFEMTLDSDRSVRGHLKYFVIDKQLPALPLWSTSLSIDGSEEEVNYCWFTKAQITDSSLLQDETRASCLLCFGILEQEKNLSGI